MEFIRTNIHMHLNHSKITKKINEWFPKGCRNVLEPKSHIFLVKHLPHPTLHNCFLKLSTVVGALGQTMKLAVKPVEEAAKLEAGEIIIFLGFNLHQLFIRSCTSPSPSCGGTSCAGGSSEVTSCNNQCCGNTFIFNFITDISPINF